MARLIVILGAESRQGISVVETLEKYPDTWHIRAVALDERRFRHQDHLLRHVTIVHCHYDNYDECYQILSGAYGVFAVMNFWNTPEECQSTFTKNIVDAARAAKVKHLIISEPANISLDHNHQCPSLSYPMNKTAMQAYIRSLPIDRSFLYTTYIDVSFYYQHMISFFVPDSFVTTFRYPSFSSRAIPMFDVADTGKIIHELFSHPDQWGDGQVVSLLAEYLTMEQICQVIRNVLNKEIQFVPLSYEEALIKLHRETINQFKWYQDTGSDNRRAIEAKNEKLPKLKTFLEWVQESQWKME